MDTSAIGNALVAVLGSDAALLALMPNGAYFDPPAGATRYVRVKHQASEDVAAFGGRAYESALYSVTAVGLVRPGAPAPDLHGAARRIDELLEDQALTVAGYAWMTTHREEFVRYPEPEGDGSLTWHHRGGLYRVEMAAADAVAKVLETNPRVTTGHEETAHHGD